MSVILKTNLLFLSAVGVGYIMTKTGILSLFAYALCYLLIIGDKKLERSKEYE